MGKRLYVGNLPYSATDADLAALFKEAGVVASARVIVDRTTGRSKGFGFVEMGSDEEARKAIETLNGREISGRAVSVNEARPAEPRGPGAPPSGPRAGAFAPLPPSPERPARGARRPERAPIPKRKSEGRKPRRDDDDWRRDIDF